MYRVPECAVWCPQGACPGAARSEKAEAKRPPDAGLSVEAELLPAGGLVGGWLIKGRTLTWFAQ